MSDSIYSYTINSLNGEMINLEAFKNKVILIVNTASKCGYTPQYGGLEDLYQKYKDQGLVIIGCPCNQFGNQEPGDAKDIEENCLVNYGVTFPVTEKIDVNGDNTHPLFEFLKTQAPGILGSTSIKWNFTKFLVDKSGHNVQRFGSDVEPKNLESEIEKLL